MMLSTALLVTALQPQAEFDYINRSGLRWTVQGIPILRGSMYQYFRGEWQGLLSSSWTDQQIEKRPDGSIRVTFVAVEKNATGQIEYRLKGNELTIDYRFEWNGEGDVFVEKTFGNLWAPVFDPQKTEFTPEPALWRDTTGPQAPRYPHFRGQGPASITLQGPAGRLTLTHSRSPFGINDPRLTRERRETIWIGALQLPASKGQPATGKVTMKWEPSPQSAAPPVRVDLKSQADIIAGPVAPLPLIPKPKKSTMAAAELPLPGEITGPKELVQLFRSGLARRWSGGTFGTGKVEFLVDNLNMAKEGYRIESKPGHIRVIGQDAQGLRHGVQSLVQLARPNRGQFQVPQGTIDDWPSLTYRGVHMFVGPEALSFQTRLLENVLAPAKYNQVVLQCERTDWRSLPGIKTDQFMTREDLRRLFALYRAAGINPVPLIQSFGHMGWIFNNGKNRDLAFNPEVLFSIDPRKPRTREVLSALWAEADKLLNPDTFHFGLDEVDMRGWPNDPKLVTDLWVPHVQWLGQLAKKHDAKMMVWGDKLLAPGEAPDAAHGHTPADAKARRDALPDGTLIGDWHYKDDPNPKIYTSLDLFKREGHIPIATTWNRPGNVYGFIHAAIDAGTGVLQSTWAGYESNESNMLREFDQFAAYILAGEYAWSGRKDLPGQIGYDTYEALQRAFYGGPVPTRPIEGVAFGADQAQRRKIRVGPHMLTTMDIPLQSVLVRDRAAQPVEALLTLDKPLPRVAMGLTTAVPMELGDRVATLEITTDDGRVTRRDVQYGYDVRAERDAIPTFRTWRERGISAVIVESTGPASRQPGANRIRSIKVLQANSFVGLRIAGMAEAPATR